MIFQTSLCIPQFAVDRVPLNAEAMTVLNHQLGHDPTYVFTYQRKPVWQVNTKYGDDGL
jgi:hypothetical protein